MPAMDSNRKSRWQGIGCRLSALVLAAWTLAASAGEIDVEDILAAHCQAREALTSLRATFTQTRVFTLFEEEEYSAGEFLYKAPRRALWQYREPDRSRTVMNGEAGWTLLPDIKQIQKVSLEGSGTDRVLSIVGFGPCTAELTDYFAVALLDATERWFHLSLTPSEDSIGAIFSQVELFLDRDDFLPRKIILYDISNDRIEFAFADLEAGADIADSLFIYSVPEDYEIVEY